ncbi:MAG TPA: sialidase family protein [Chitinophagaceae bacterium]|nr:sialidase family protein [Chitinophagaceae bacterium]
MNKLLNTLLLIIVFASCNDSKKTDNAASSLKQLNSPADSVSAEPYLFTDKNGLVYLSWIEKTKQKSLFKFSALNNDTWSVPDTITSGNSWFVNWADYPMLAADGAGNMIAHILEKSENGKYTYDVKLSTSADSGSSWSATNILHDDGKKAEHGFVSLMPYKDQFFVSWLDGRNTVSEKGDTSAHHEGHHGAMSLRAAIVNMQGTKTAEWELDKRVCDCCQTSAALTANGPVVVYRDRSEEEIRDISIVRFVNGNWTEPKTIFPDQWKIAGCPVNGPRVATEGNNLVIAWFSSPDKKAQVNIIFSGDGGASFNKPIRIDEENALGRVDVVMLDEKSAMVSWMEGGVIKAVKVYKDGKKDAALIVASSSESRSSGFPQMTKSGNNLIFAWTDDKNKTIKVAKLSL